MENEEFYHQRAHKLIPGGAHTYSKGDDQFPANAPKFIVRGEGCDIFDTQDNRYTDFALSLGTVVLGHAYEPVLEAVRGELSKGSNFVRPSIIEGELAELLVDIIPSAEMVKLAKHGSDAVTAAVKLARAATGRKYIVRCENDPFNAVHDWFIGSTVVTRGVPKEVRELTLKFEYNKIKSLMALFDGFPGEIAGVVMEPLSMIQPEPGFLEAVQKLCKENGAVLIFDEVVSGFRYSLGGAQEYCGVTPDLTAIGKAMANGFSVSALVGKKEIMELGGIHHDSERVFLLSTTHGGETHSIAAAIKTIQEIKEKNIVEHFWSIGRKFKEVIDEAAAEAGASHIIHANGFDCKPGYTLTPQNGESPMEIRTLFLQETIRRGYMLPYFVPCYAHSVELLDKFKVSLIETCGVLKKASDENRMRDYIEGDVVKPVFRKFN